MWKAIVLAFFLSLLWFYKPLVGILVTVVVIGKGVLSDEVRRHPMYLISEIIGTIWAIVLGLIIYLIYLTQKLGRKKIEVRG
jgi:hypothetical protein